VPTIYFLLNLREGFEKPKLEGNNRNKPENKEVMKVQAGDCHFGIKPRPNLTEIQYGGGGGN
jgi:hypothetical protein